MLYLVHHAEALDGIIDPQRALSDRGHAHAEALAARVASREAKPSVIWHSGKLRARQTAEYFRRACNPLATFAATHGLQPDDPPHWIVDVVNGDPRDIMLVGHMPHLLRLLGALDPGSESARAFPPHGCVAMEPQDRGWREAWRE